MRGRLAILLSLGLASSVLGAVPVAHADPPGPEALPIHVVAVKTEEADAQADALTTALKAEVRKLQGWSLGPGDFSLEVLSLALKCPPVPDPACTMHIADEIKADRYIWGLLDKASDNQVHGTLHFWTRAQGESKIDIAFSDNLTEASDETLRQIVRDKLRELIGGPPKGSVRVSAGSVDGQLFIDGVPSGSIHNGSAVLQAPAGVHRIEVRAKGFAPTSGEVHVLPEGAVTLTLRPVTEEDAHSGGMSISGRRLGAYGALAAGGAFALGGIYSSLQVNSINNDSAFDSYRRGVPQGINVCDAASGKVSGKTFTANSDIDDKCSRASTFQTLQWVFFGLSAASLGAGTYLLVTDSSSGPEQSSPPPPKTSLQVLPSVVPGSGGVDVRLVF